jgi:hypothetical protein
VAEFRASSRRTAQGGGPGGGQGGGGQGFGQQANRARVIFRFASDPQKLLISGGLTDGGELAHMPGLVDVPLGRGNVVMFSFNPFWRSETLGSYALVFNALLHHGNLRSTNRSSVQSAICPVFGSGVRFGVTKRRFGSPMTSISRPPAKRGTV